MHQRLKIGVIGCGAITRYLHGPDIHCTFDAELVACCDPLMDRATAIAESFGTDAQVYRDYRKLLAESAAEAVVVAVPNILHGPIAIDALKSGKHVLVEKPMATSSAEAKKMVDTARKAGKLLMVNHSQRLEPSHIKAKEVLDSGMLGRVLHVSGTFGHSGPDNWSPTGTWFFDKAQARFGTMADLGIHKADLLRWLTGKDIVEIGAFVERLQKKGSVDDNFVSCIKFSDGSVGTLSSSWTVYGQSETHTIFHCENGTLRLNTEPDRPVAIYLERPQGDFQLAPPPPASDYEGSWGLDVGGRFARACLGLEKPYCTGEEGWKSLEVVLAAEKSAQTGRIVKVKHW
ncbi:MAG: Gfo/Idh/MocA family oxidoreductase [Candidatus Hydrogenedentes bacterium]|nr:Gfo/Idh/MocA family oxidoreductase [Candidatus Hydrogenedentota bacterium]